MKIHILTQLREGAWGGGNQFLKALKKEWKQQGVYEDNADNADALLFNSYPFRAEYLFDEVYRLKKKFPEKIIIFRLNGPISHHRQRDSMIDKIIAQFNKLFVDGIIFQSSWCEKKNQEHFGIVSHYQTVIHNASDKKIFHNHGRRVFNPTRIKLIATSWSSNPRKGFDVYAYLDTHLDFSKYDMTFVGNSPMAFRNITMIPPISSEELAPILRGHDFFITASNSEACSNAVIEALSSGLPVVARDSGSHAELVRGGGELFEGTHDVLEKINRVAKQYAHYQERIPVFDLGETACRYYEFSKRIWLAVQGGQYHQKKCNQTGLLRIKIMIFFWKIKNTVQSVIKIVWRI